ncbi:NAD(P)H-binding protein [Paenibacillus harenae]|uniref:NAD(P)H-binding protein n=1 Tax=Paenibacillus harenae TaxID=306543 RepID=UPI00278DE5B1|nr:NAD(P)H-binding protein [Paenibacillus harenae]MDQ0057898.1 uncharacterized protein YbjT (DUF2867 family) [Paenibacillus harenae]
MNRKAVVVGATGLIGKELVELLLNNRAYVDVTLLVRRRAGITHPKLREMVIDFDLLEQSDVNLTGADVFCTLGTTIKKAGTQEAFRQVDFAYPLALGRMAKTQGAKQLLIVTAMGADTSSRFFYNRVKGEIEVALNGLGLPALHIFRPSLLLGNREEFRLGERIGSSLSRILSPLFSGRLRKYRPIQARSVAKAMLLAARSSQSGILVYQSDRIARTAEQT